MPRKDYPPEFRRKVLDLVEAGRPVRQIAQDLGISDQTIYTWRRQDLIDKGQAPGTTSTEQTELLAAGKLGWLSEGSCGCSPGRTAKTS